MGTSCTMRGRSKLAGQLSFGLGLCVVVSAAACGGRTSEGSGVDSKDGGIDVGDGSDETTGNESSTTAAESDSKNDSGSDGGDSSGTITDPDSTKEMDVCDPVQVKPDIVTRPVDIIVVVDTSRSMSFEAGAVQTKLNEFANSLEQAGVSHQMTLYAQCEAMKGTQGGGGNQDILMTIPPPLGGGESCPTGNDSNPPSYVHAPPRIGSNDALLQLMCFYENKPNMQFDLPNNPRQSSTTCDETAYTPITLNELSNGHSELDFPGGQWWWWKERLRADAKTHFLIISDDESWVSAKDFEDFIGGAEVGDYAVHSVVSHSECEQAAAIGQVYIDLADETGGISTDLCLQDFQTVFDTLLEAVVESSLDCSVGVPKPPGQFELSIPASTLVINHGNMPIKAMRVATAADCTGKDDEWYFEETAGELVANLCPATCAWAKDNVTELADFTVDPVCIVRPPV